MSDAGGLRSSAVVPCESRQYERGDLHADRGLDLIAHLDGQRFPEQLHLAGHTGGGDLCLEEEGQGQHDGAGDRRSDDGVAVDRQTEPVPNRRMVADVNGGFGEDLFRHLRNHPSVQIRHWTQLGGRRRRATS